MQGSMFSVVVLGHIKGGKKSGIFLLQLKKSNIVLIYGYVIGFSQMIDIFKC